MYTLLEKKEEISAAQRALERTLRKAFSRRAVKNIGFPGGTVLGATVNTDGRHWFWSADQPADDTPNPRRLNWFGLMPPEGKGLEISVEINTPYQGKNRQVGGFFGRDNESGQVYLFHSGRVGGGTKGVAKEPFLTWTGHRLVEVFDEGGEPPDGVLVMPVEGLGAARPAVRYVDSIAAFKQAVRDGETSTAAFLKQQRSLRAFYSESHGRRRGRRSSEIDYVSRHGEVVQVLHDWRQARGLRTGQRAVKHVLIDLGIATRSDQLVEVYEVKTSVDRQSIYTALGQLFVHGDMPNCRRVMVLPEKDKLAPDLTKALQRYGVELLRYELSETGVVFR